MVLVWITSVEAQCNAGKWGGNCQYNCSTSCYHGNNCSQNVGQCGCMQTNGTCYECSTNFYGVSCDIKCDDICSLNEQCVQDGFEFACGCEREQGNCNRCPKSTWGNYCENKCSNKCINSECSWIDGICTFGCLKGFYGSDCSSACSLSCQSGCDQQTAECFPPYCVNCISGMSGCDNVTQKCKSGCITGFKGEMCDKTCAEETGVVKCTSCRHISSPIATLTYKLRSCK
ncbi:uncharacterized protein LOC143052051 [Mytilus galloprovincialis]|uniref:uncharacterized protein LOC143052051 n=1 Tax=Mytilus galloprovincialis TaxID=29158 RepID=UPI003F7CD1B8